MTLIDGERFVGLEKRISNEIGDLALFALVLRQGSEDKWDLLISASWIEPNKGEALRSFVRMYSRGRPGEWEKISRLVLLDPRDPAVLGFQNFVGVEHGWLELQNCVVEGIHVEHAYVVTSRKRPPLDELKRATSKQERRLTITWDRIVDICKKRGIEIILKGSERKIKGKDPDGNLRVMTIGHESSRTSKSIVWVDYVNGFQRCFGITDAELFGPHEEHRE